MKKKGGKEDFQEFDSLLEELEREDSAEVSESDGEKPNHALVRVQKRPDIETLRQSVIENAQYLPREIAEKLGIVILEKPFGSYQYRVGVLKKLSVDDSRRLSRQLNTYSVSSIKFEVLDAMIFDVLLREAYEVRNLTRVATRQNQQQTRHTRVWGGTSSGGTSESKSERAEKQELSIEKLAGQRLDITDLDSYYEVVRKLDSGELNENDLETPAFVKFLLQDFSLSGASDLHIHSGRKAGRIRYRFQGIPYTRFSGIPLYRFRQLVNSLCTLAGKDPSRLNREEVASVIKLKVKFEEEIKDVEFRFQGLPTLHSPSMNLRGQMKPLRDIHKVGFTSEQLADIKEAVSKDHGIVIVTGPTGSGKTNTLNCVFALLEEQDDKVIVELGSPIEIESDNRVQITILEAASEKLTDIIYQKFFKAVMRFDPDVIAFTEIRIADEARIAFRAANTGHLVFTTLHAADVEETFGRLFEMNLDRSVIAKGILGIVSQTLIQKLCVNCRVEDEDVTAMAGTTVYRENQAGCSECDKGFAGRTVVAEVLYFNDDIRKMIVEGCKPSEIVSRAISLGYMTPMKRIALRKLNEGITSESEVVNLVELRTKLNADLEEMPEIFDDEFSEADDYFEAEIV